MKLKFKAGVFVACVVAIGVSTGYAYASKQVDLTNAQKQKVQATVQDNIAKVHNDLKVGAGVTSDYLDLNLNNINDLKTNKSFAPGVGQKIENAITQAIHEHGELNYYEPVFFVKNDASEFVVAFKQGDTGVNDILRYKLQGGQYVKVESKSIQGLKVDPNVQVN